MTLHVHGLLIYLCSWNCMFVILKKVIAASALIWNKGSIWIWGLSKYFELILCKILYLQKKKKTFVSCCNMLSEFVIKSSQYIILCHQLYHWCEIKAHIDLLCFLIAIVTQFLCNILLLFLFIKKYIYCYCFDVDFSIIILFYMIILVNKWFS